MRQRGAQFGGLSVGEGTTGALTSLCVLLNTELIVWSMPGGFTSNTRGGYQNLDDETYNHQSRHPPSRNDPKSPAQAQVNNNSTPGAYDTV